MQRTELFYGILLFFGAVLIFFIGFEIVLRVFDFGVGQRTNEFIFYEYNETLGWKNKANAAGVFNMADASNYVEINSKGIRDFDYGYKKGKAKRIVVLGDSHTWGFGINDSFRYTEVLENLSNGEVVNMGVAGYGTDQEYLTLKLEGLRYNPDVVIIGYHTGSDLEDNANNVRYGYPKPQFVFSDGKLKLEGVPAPLKEDWEKRVYENEAWYRKVDRVLSNNLLSYAFFRNRLLAVGFLRNLSVKLELSKQERIEENFDEKISLTLQLIKEMNELSKKNKAKLLVVIIPTKVQVYSDGSGKQNKAIVEFAEENSILVLDLLDPFKESEEKLYFDIDPHWNANGNRLAAELIYEKLINESILK